MAVEREVSAIDGEIAIQCSFNLLIVGAGNRQRRRPIEAVVADQEVDAFCDGGFKGARSSINCCADLSHSAVVLELKAIVSAIEVFDFRAAGALITKSDDFLKLCHG